MKLLTNLKLAGRALIGRPAIVAGNQLNGWVAPAAQVRWLGPGVTAYTPQRVEQIFRQALSGDLQSQWEMFDLMEATSPRLSKNLNQLKDAVAAEPFQVWPFAEREQPSASAVEKAALVEDLLWGMKCAPASDENDFPDTMRDLMDARGKGHSVLEVDWEVLADGQRERRIVPRCTRWVHPAWYGYPQGSYEGALKLRLPSTINSQLSAYPGDTSRSYGPDRGGVWSDFPEHKFLIGLCKNKTGHPLGSAMLHVLGFWWAAANFSGEWFLNLAQVFGQPFRWALYDASMTPADQATLKAMLANMGSAAYGLFPRGTEMNFLESNNVRGAETAQERLINYYDTQCDLLILRQTLSSDVSQKSGSRAQGEVHERVLDDVKGACCDWVYKTLDQLITSILILNYGDDSEKPYLAGPEEEDQDANQLADTLYKLSQAGLEPTAEALGELSERFGYELERKAEIEKQKTEIADGGNGNGKLSTEANKGNEEGLNGKSVSMLARNNGRGGLLVEGTFAREHPSDQVAKDKAALLAKHYRQSMAPFRQAILDSTSAEDALHRVARAYADWSPERVANEVEEALQLCAAKGL